MGVLAQNIARLAKATPARKFSLRSQPTMTVSAKPTSEKSRFSKMAGAASHTIVRFSVLGRKSKTLWLGSGCSIVIGFSSVVIRRDILNQTTPTVIVHS
jgi:hypothetical protein